MLKGLESSGVVRHSSTCCQVCSCGIIPYGRLDILKPGTRQYRKKPRTVRCISDDVMKELEAKLHHERKQFLDENSCYRIFGPQCICCDSVIKELCSKAKFITDVEDLSSVKLLRPELRSRFFDVIMNTVGNEPPAKRQRRH